MELLKPTNDYVFKKIFGQKKNKDILKDLLGAILTDVEIKKIETKKESYTATSRTICICILNYIEFVDGPFHEIADIRRRYNNLLLTDKLELHYVQLPKFRKKCKVISSKLDEWLTFISTNSLEELKMIDNKYVKQAAEELEYLTGDEETRRLAELRDKEIRDRVSAIDKATKLGKEEGIKEGIDKGISSEKRETAKKMIAKKCDINLIIEITGLTKEQIEELN